MLWSDPPDEPPEEMRQAQRMMRRAIWLIAVAMPIIMLIVGRPF
jgi:hypothetical protein